MAEVARGPVSVAVVPPGSTLPAEIDIDREKVTCISTLLMCYLALSQGMGF